MLHNNTLHPWSCPLLKELTAAECHNIPGRDIHHSKIPTNAMGVSRKTCKRTCGKAGELLSEGRKNKKRGQGSNCCQHCSEKKRLQLLLNTWRAVGEKKLNSLHLSIYLVVFFAVFTKGVWLVQRRGLRLTQWPQAGSTEQMQWWCISAEKRVTFSFKAHCEACEHWTHARVRFFISFFSF